MAASPLLGLVEVEGTFGETVSIRDNRIHNVPLAKMTSNTFALRLNRILIIEWTSASERVNFSEKLV